MQGKTPPPEKAEKKKTPAPEKKEEAKPAEAAQGKVGQPVCNRWRFHVVSVRVHRKWLNTSKKELLARDKAEPAMANTGPACLGHGASSSGNFNDSPCR